MEFLPDSNITEHEDAGLLLSRAVDVALALCPDPMPSQPGADVAARSNDWKRLKTVSDEALASLIVDAGASVPDEQLPRSASRWPLVVHALGGLGSLGTEESKRQVFDLLRPIAPEGLQRDIAVELFGKLGEAGVTYAREFFRPDTRSNPIDRVHLRQLDTIASLTRAAIGGKVVAIQDPKLKILAIEHALTRAPDLEEAYRDELINIAIKQSSHRASEDPTSWFLDLKRLLAATHDDRIVAMLEACVDQGGGLNIQRLLLDKEYGYRAIAYDVSYIEKMTKSRSRINVLAALALQQASEEKQRTFIEQALALYEQGDLSGVTEFPLTEFIGVTDSNARWLIESYQRFGEVEGLAKRNRSAQRSDELHEDGLPSPTNEPGHVEYVHALSAIIAANFETLGALGKKQQALAYTAIACSGMSLEVREHALNELYGKRSEGYMVLPDYRDRLKRSIIEVNHAELAEILPHAGIQDVSYIETLAAMVTERQNGAALWRLLNELENIVFSRGHDLQIAWKVGETIAAIAPTLGVLNQ